MRDVADRRCEMTRPVEWMRLWSRLADFHAHLCVDRLRAWESSSALRGDLLRAARRHARLSEIARARADEALCRVSVLRCDGGAR